MQFHLFRGGDNYPPITLAIKSEIIEKLWVLHPICKVLNLFLIVLIFYMNNEGFYHKKKQIGDWLLLSNTHRNWHTSSYLSNKYLKKNPKFWHLFLTYFFPILDHHGNVADYTPTNMHTELCVKFHSNQQSSPLTSHHLRALTSNNLKELDSHYLLVSPVTNH